MKSLFVATSVALVALYSAAMAQTVVPEAELEASVEQFAVGAPTETSGISAIINLGIVPLAGEFETPNGRVLRTREIVLEPNGTVAMHRHEGRPGVAYIIEGEVTEHRVGLDGKAVVSVKTAGETALESTGVVHWWINESGKTVRALVVDIVPAG